jgi:hypothetical protein
MHYDGDKKQNKGRRQATGENGREGWRRLHSKAKAGDYETKVEVNRRGRLEVR